MPRRFAVVPDFCVSHCARTLVVANTVSARNTSLGFIAVECNAHTRSSRGFTEVLAGDGRADRRVVRAASLQGPWASTTPTPSYVLQLNRRNDHEPKARHDHFSLHAGPGGVVPVSG